MISETLGQLRIEDNGLILDKVEAAIKRLQSFCPEEGYYLCFSGGKDSQCIYHLAKMANVKFDAHYNVTSVDPPEVTRFIREQYPDVKFDVPMDQDGKPVTMRSIILKKGLMPTRVARFCCEKLKEGGGKGRIVVTGVRWAESVSRSNTHGAVTVATRSKKLIDQAQGIAGAQVSKKGTSVILNDDNDEARRMVEQCYRTRKTLVNPIVDWTDDDVWSFLNNIAKVPHCSLYDEGQQRIGCVGCPMAKKKRREQGFERWPQYAGMYKTCIRKLLQRGKFPRIAPNELPMEDRINRVWGWWLSDMSEEKYVESIEARENGR